MFTLLMMMAMTNRISIQWARDRRLHGSSDTVWMSYAKSIRPVSSNVSRICVVERPPTHRSMCVTIAGKVDTHKTPLQRTCVWAHSLTWPLYVRNWIFTTRVWESM